VSDEANASHSADHIELWRNWNEATSTAWSSIPAGEKEAYRDSFDLFSLWLRPGAYFKLWYNITYGLWAHMFGEMLHSGRWLEANSHILEAYMGAVRASHFVNEEVLQHLQVPSRAEVARVAKHVVALEERVYMIEGAFVSFADGDPEADPEQVVDGPVAHQQQVSDKLETVDAFSSMLEPTGVIGDLTGRLQRVEDKLNKLLSALEKIEARVLAQPSLPDDKSEGLKN
jgi:hypothetical protein